MVESFPRFDLFGPGPPEFGPDTGPFVPAAGSKGSPKTGLTRSRSLADTAHCFVDPLTSKNSFGTSTFPSITRSNAKFFRCCKPPSPANALAKFSPPVYFLKCVTSVFL